LELFSRQLPPDHDLILFSDAHEGTILQETGGLFRLRDKIENEKNTFCAFGGDWAEAILVDDKRYAPETDRKLLPLQQYQAGKEFFRPIARKTLFFEMGNHDWILAAKYGNIVKDILCTDLGIPYGTYTAKLSVRNKKDRQMYKLFYTHGAKSIFSTADDPIRREANMLLQLKRRLSMKAGDCEVMAMAHTHKLLVAAPMLSLYLHDDGQKIRSAYTGPSMGESQWIHPDHRWYCNTGSFLRLYADRKAGEGVSGYAERFGYDPVELGYVVIECRRGKIANVRKEVVA
jgi:hypothetical protein